MMRHLVNPRKSTTTDDNLMEKRIKNFKFPLTLSDRRAKTARLQGEIFHRKVAIAKEYSMLNGHQNRRTSTGMGAITAKVLF